ncbi:MAG TPA: ABC transporter permease [Clostridia bacterium]|nr:ABC transporter permease [Clostridia bacterium]
MRNILLIITNNLKVSFRKKGNIIVYIFLPLLGVLFSMLIFSGAGNPALKVGVADADKSTLSADLKGIMQNREGFAVSDTAEGQINKKLLESELDAAVIIPEGFGKSVYDGQIKNIEVVSLKGQATTAWLEQMLNSHIGSLLRLSAAAGGDSAKFDKMYSQQKNELIKLDVVKLEDNVSSKNMTLTAIGLLIMFMMLGTSFTSMLILKEKRNRTYHRICSAPVNAWKYILANAVTSLIITIIQILFIQLAMKYLFRIDTGIGDVEMFIILLMFGLVSIGVGLVVTAFSSSSYMASTLSSLIMTPTCMLGGCFWSVSMMPEFMRKLSYFMPQRWAMEALEKLQAGDGISGVYLNLFVLFAFALALMLISAYKFSRTSNVQKFV